MKRLLLFVLLALTAVPAEALVCFTETVTPTRTTTPTRTVTSSVTKTRTITKTRTNTRTVTGTPTPTPTPTTTPTRTTSPTRSITQTGTFTPTVRSTWTRTVTATPTFTSTSTITATSTKTSTATPTSTQTPAPTTIADWRFENNLNDSGPSALTLTASGSVTYDTGAPACQGTYAMNCTAGFGDGGAGVLAGIDGLTSFTITAWLYTPDVTTLQYVTIIQSDNNLEIRISGGDLIVGGASTTSQAITTNTCLEVVVTVVPGLVSLSINGSGATSVVTTCSTVNVVNFGVGGTSLAPGNPFLGDVGGYKITTP